MELTEEVKKLCKETAEGVAALRKYTDETIAAQLKGLPIGELKTATEKINDRLDKIDARKEAIEKALTELNRQRLAPAVKGLDGKDAPEDYKEAVEAFRNFARTGSADGSKSAMQERREFRFHPKDDKGNERKSLSVINDQDGGFSVLADMSGAVAKKVFETSPIMSVCRVQVISTDALEGPRDFDEADCGWVGEKEARTETDTPELGEYRIPAFEVYAAPRITQKLLDDSAMPIEQWLIDKVADKFRRTQNTAFVSGNGVKKPRGFLDYAAGTTIGSQVQQVVSGHATLLTGDGLIALQDSLKSVYAVNAKWAMSRDSRRQVRQLKDSQGRYIWEASLALGQPQRLLGADLLEFQDMPNVAASALPVAYADWMEFYTVVRRTGMRILRDPYTAKPYIIMYCTERVGGDVHNTEAGALQVIST